MELLRTKHLIFSGLAAALLSGCGGSGAGTAGSAAPLSAASNFAINDANAAALPAPVAPGDRSGGLRWLVVSGGAITAAPNYGYIASNAGTSVTITLPASLNEGDIIRVSGAGAGGWTIAQNSKQTIYYGGTASLGLSGGQYSAVELQYIGNESFMVLSSEGQLTSQGSAPSVVDLTFDGANGSTSFGAGVTGFGNAQISTAQAFAGGSSLYLDGNNSYIEISNPQLNFGSGNFAVSFEVMVDGAQNPYAVLISAASGTQASCNKQIEIDNSTGASGLVANLTNQGTNPGVITAPMIADANWHLVKFSRINNVASLYEDGALLGQFNVPASETVNLNNILIGKWQCNNLPDNSFKGWIDNVVISAE